MMELLNMYKLTFAIFTMFLTASIGSAAQLVWITEKALGAAQQLPNCNPEKDQNCSDYVPYVSVSKYGVKVFQTYHEGTRITLSFNGKDENGFTVSTDQLYPGGYDWGGVVIKGKFKPLYMIKRFYAYDSTLGEVTKAHSELTVVRLLENGKFCGVVTGNEVVTDNRVARRFAEMDFAHPTCSK
jgi:hypothetical protein